MADNSNKLVDQSQALDSFFESLMRDVEAYDEKESNSKLQNENGLRTVDLASAEQTQLTAKDNASETIAPIPELKSEPESEQEQIEPTKVESEIVEVQQVEPEQQATAETSPIQTSPIEPVAPAVEPSVSAATSQASQLKEAPQDNRIFEGLPPVVPDPVVTPTVKQPASEPEIAEIEAIELDKVEPEASEQATEETQPVPAGRPEWAESEFQAMMFKVAGLALAVPLIELNGVVECDLSNVTAMPGHADFYLGLMNYLEKSVPLVDTARFVLPPDKLKILAGDDPKERITRVVMIQDCKYGLACDEVNEVITLNPDSVRWRSQRTQRRWLAGTVVEHMCALIDANAFAELLASRAPIQEFRE